MANGDKNGTIYRYALPMLASLITSLIGGFSGAWLTLQLHEYRIGQLEKHEEQDRINFSIDAARDALLATEIAAIRERHRLEDLTRERLREGR